MCTTHGLGSFKLPTKGGKPKLATAKVEKKAVAAKAVKPKKGFPSFGKSAPKAKVEKAKPAKPAAKAKVAKAKPSKPAPKAKVSVRSSATKTIVVEDLPGVLPPVGLFDPLGLAAKADDNTIRKYREAELTHGRIAMVASLGFFVGELAPGKFFNLYPEVTSGTGILQIYQVPGVFWVSFFAAAFAIETSRVQRAIVDPTTASKEEIGKYRTDYIPGDLGFDPLGLKSDDPEVFKSKQTKELQNGRLAMLAVSGFLAQELSDKKGLVEHLLGYIPQDILDQLPQLPF